MGEFKDRIITSMEPTADDERRMPHPWSRDPVAQSAVRAAEDAAAVPAIQHRDLPEQVALLWASVGDLIGRVVRLEGEMDAGQDEEAAPAVCDSVPPANGLRTERVTPPWQRAKWDEALAIICDGGDWGRGNNFDHGVLGALVIWADKEMDRLTAERDAALRERDAAKEECERRLTMCESMKRERDAAQFNVSCLTARVAELEGAAKLAPDRNAGGGSNHPVAWLHEELGSCFLYPNDELKSKCVPLYASPQPPRGWLTEEERAWLENEASRISNHLGEVAAMHTVGSTIRPQQMRKDVALLRALLARETPPRVKVPTVILGALPTAREQQWHDAIRDAGGEVE